MSVDISIYPSGGQCRPPGDWRQVQPRFDVAGLLHYRSAVEAFIKGADSAAASDLRYGLTAIREPQNPYGSTAIAVYGEWARSASIGIARSAKSEKIGYVPRDYSRVLDVDVPVAIELESARMFRKDNGDYFINVTAFLLIPSKKSGFWQDRKPPPWR